MVGKRCKMNILDDSCCMEKEQVEKTFKAISDEISKIEKEKSKINKQLCELNNKKIKLLQKKCKKNIGRCFKKIQNNKVVGYYKVTCIDKVHCRFDRMDFNEYQYPSLYFKYPYDNSIVPFHYGNLFSGAWGHGNNALAAIRGVAYIEITNSEFIKKLKEVNELWLNRINSTNSKSK